MKVEKEQLDLEDWEEHYGPIDGVRPLDHHETYALLIASICIGQVNNEEKIYITEGTTRRRLCEECYISNGQPQNYRHLETKHTLHLIAYLNKEIAFKCYSCKKEIMKNLGSARHCRNCIEEFVYYPYLSILEPELIVKKRY